MKKNIVGKINKCKAREKAGHNKRSSEILKRPNLTGHCDNKICIRDVGVLPL